jgi:lipopolysaccharide heptosyltransferase I
MSAARTPLAEYSPSRIAIIKPSALGDIVHALPVLTALRCRYPQAHLAWVVNSSYEPLLKGHPDLNETIPFDRAGLRKGWRAALGCFRSLWREVRRRDVDLAIDLQGLFRSGLMTWATGASRRVGLSTAREGAHWFYTDRVPVSPGEIHAVDRYWLVAEALGAGGGPKEFRLPSFESEAAWVEATLRSCPGPWLMVGVGARWQTKRWPPRHFAALLQRAQSAFGGTALFVGSAEDSAAALAALQELRGPGLLLTGRTTLTQLGALLSRADVMLANDTGPLHLAAALGRPVVASYTCTRVRLTGPYGHFHTAVETRVHCAGSLLKKCSRLECMDELTPERLWPLLEEVLSRWQKSHNNRSA